MPKINVPGGRRVGDFDNKKFWEKKPQDKDKEAEKGKK